MEWQKAPEELVQFLAEKMKNVNCDFRKMFGYPAYFVNGNMFAGIHGSKLFVRLSEEDVKRILKANSDVSLFEPMPGRPMKGYVVLPQSMYSKDATFDEWLEKSFKYVSGLPPKKKKPSVKPK
jgi:TfoX/Sxy family transcriptional regulator of competence genes